MIDMLILLLWLAVTGVLSVGGYLKVRAFVRHRLRYVEAVRRPWVPWAAGAVAAGLALPLSWLLPVVGGGTALLFGIGIGAGVAAGRREFKRLPGG